MKLEFSEKDIINILNCINITLNFLYEHTLQEKRNLEVYFDFENYYEHFSDLKILHNLISINANKFFYNCSDSIYFKGQENYLNSKK